MNKIVREPSSDYSEKPFFIFRGGRFEITNPRKEVLNGADEKRFINQKHDLAYKLVGMWA